MSSSRNQLQLRRYRYRRSTPAGWDPFSEAPIRRSLLASTITGSILVVPSFLLPAHVSLFVLLSFGWMMVPVFVMSLTVLGISLIEELWRVITRRLHPAIDELDISSPLANVLRRHDLELIEQVDSVPDAMLLLIPNLDQRGLAQVRRAISLWKYRRWQAAGFPDTGP